MNFLQQEAELQEIVKLVGQDSLSAADRLTLETSRMIREDYLQQNAFVDIDNFSTYDRQARMLEMILQYDKLARSALKEGADMKAVFGIEARIRIARAKNVPPEEYAQVYDRILSDMAKQLEKAKAGGDEL